MMTRQKAGSLALLLCAMVASAGGSSSAQIVFTPNDNFGGGSQGNVLVGSPWNSVTHIDANLNGAPAALDGFVQVD